MRRIDRDIERTRRDIERKQAAVRRRARQDVHRPQPRLEPISREKAKEYATHAHPSTPEVRADVVARAALRHLQGDIARSRRMAPGAAVSGYQFLGSAVGPDLAALLPGVLNASGTRPHATARGVATNLYSLSPYLRGPRAILRAAHAARAARPLEEVAAVARPRPHYWSGPVGRSASRVLYTEMNPHLSKPFPDWNRDGFIDYRDAVIDMQMQLKKRQAEARQKK
jgi:hypothetical protein